MPQFPYSSQRSKHGPFQLNEQLSGQHRTMFRSERSSLIWCSLFQSRKTAVCVFSRRRGYFCNLPNFSRLERLPLTSSAEFQNRSMRSETLCHLKKFTTNKDFANNYARMTSLTLGKLHFGNSHTQRTIPLSGTGF